MRLRLETGRWHLDLQVERLLDSWRIMEIMELGALGQMIAIRAILATPSALLLDRTCGQNTAPVSLQAQADFCLVLVTRELARRSSRPRTVAPAAGS
jgi:hypothetical protein